MTDTIIRLTDGLDRSGTIFAGYVLSHLALHGAIEEAAAITLNALVQAFTADGRYRPPEGARGATLKALYALRQAGLIGVVAVNDHQFIAGYTPAYWLLR